MNNENRNHEDEIVSLEKHKDISIIIFSIPVISTLVIWLWVAYIPLSQHPESILQNVMYVNTFATACAIAFEVSQNNRPKEYPGTPLVWFLAILFIWPIVYPYYFYKRSILGLKRQLFTGCIITLIFMLSFVSVFASIEVENQSLIPIAETTTL